MPGTTDQTRQPPATGTVHADQDTPPAGRATGPAGPPASRPDRRRRVGSGLAGVAAAVACLACLLPLLAAGGLAAGLAAAVTDIDLILLAVAAAVLTTAGAWVSRRRARRKTGSCDCDGCGSPGR